MFYVPILAKSARTVFCYFFSTEFSTALEVMDCSWMYWPNQWCQLAIDSSVYCTFSQRNVCSRGIWCITNDFDRFWRFWRAVQAKAINNVGALLKYTRRVQCLRQKEWSMMGDGFLSAKWVLYYTLYMYQGRAIVRQNKHILMCLGSCYHILEFWLYWQTELLGKYEGFAQFLVLMYPIVLFIIWQRYPRQCRYIR